MMRPFGSTLTLQPSCSASCGFANRLRAHRAPETRRRASRLHASGTADVSDGRSSRPSESNRSPGARPRSKPSFPSPSPSPRPAGPLSGPASTCMHFKSCSGCSLDGLEAAGRPAQYLEARQFFSSRGYDNFQLVVGPLHGWRCRAKLAVRGTASRPQIGLFKQGSHDIVDIVPGCDIQHPRINEAAKLIKQLVTQLKVAPYSEAPPKPRGGPKAAPGAARTGRQKQSDVATAAAAAAAAAGQKAGGTLRYLQLTAVGNEASGLRAELDPNASVQVVLVVNASSKEDAAFKSAAQLARALWMHSGAPSIRVSSSSGSTLHQTPSSPQPASPSSRGAASGRPPASPASPLIHSVWINLHPESNSNAVLGSAGWERLHGEPDVWQAFGGVPVCLGPGSFVQANYGAFQSALASIRRFVPGGSSVLELHAGIGAIGLSLFSQAQRQGATAAAGDAAPGSPLGPAPRALRCVEINPHAEPPFLKSRSRLMQQLQQQQQQQQQGTSPLVEYVVAAAGADPEGFLEGAEVVIVDPPRKGLERSVLEALTGGGRGGGNAESSGSGSRLHSLVYLSCGWEALKGEFDVLVPPAATGGGGGEGEGAWSLVHAQAFLFFPGTDSIETLCIFQRRVGAKS